MIRMIRGGGPLVGLLSVLAAILLGPVAHANAAPGDPLPTAPLSEVTAGETCEARTVLKGTEITAFEVKILDVVKPGSMGFGSLIYFEVTDPAVAPLGVAEGMSGSPILCEINGEDKVVGAISYGLAAIGPKAFATPIDDVLNGQPAPGFSASRSSETPVVGGRKLVELSPPLAVSGVLKSAQNKFRARLALEGFDSVNFVAANAVDVPADSADLAPGGSFSINYAYGDVTIGAICTISYRDGDDFWGCGHPLDLAGQRSISFSGAYIYDTVGDAWSLQPSFKLGAATPTQVGSVLYDGPYAVSGRFGQQAPTTPVKLTYRTSGKTIALESHAVNETSLPGGPPTGTSFPGVASTAMAVQAQFSGAGQPVNQNGRVCMKQQIIGAGKQLSACSRFTSSSAAWLYTFWGEPTGAAVPTDFLVGGLDLILGQVKYKKLYPGALDVTIDIETGSALRQIIGLRPLGQVRAGRSARFAVVSAESDGTRHRQVITTKVPKWVKLGRNKFIPMPKGRQKFEVASSAFSGGTGFDSSTLATDNDGSAYFRVLGGLWSGRSSINNPAELDQKLDDVFRKKARLYLMVPWRKEAIGFPLKGGGDVLVGSSTRRVKLLPAAVEPSSRGPVR